MRRIDLAQISLVFSLAALFSGAADAEMRRYVINPGGQYSYFPSPEGSGIPGGVPSAYELNFTITGAFRLDFTDSMARFRDVGLALLGNESVQANPPPLALVTSERVEEWLESRRLIQQPVLGPFNLYTDESFSQLELFDILNGQVTLEGGFDARPADGNGINFRFGATFSPEAERNLVWVGDGQANLWDIDTSEDWMSSLGKERFLN